MAATDLLYAWLKDAHGMEKALAEFSERVRKNYDGHPEVSGLLDSIIEHSTQDQDTIKALLDADESKVSAGKDFIAKIGSFISGAGSSVFGDDKVKDVLALHGVLHFAHACYVSLASGASQLGEESIASASESLAGKKEDLANKVLDIIPTVTNAALAEKS